MDNEIFYEMWLTGTPGMPLREGPSTYYHKYINKEDYFLNLIFFRNGEGMGGGGMLFRGVQKKNTDYIKCELFSCERRTLIFLHISSKG